MFSFVKTVKRPICKAFIEFTFRHIPLIFSVYLLISDMIVIASVFDVNFFLVKT
jgi:Ca2+/Na+ antiporter